VGEETSEAAQLATAATLYSCHMEASVSPRLRQVLEAQPALRERALVLLSCVEPHSLGELAALLGCSRPELMNELGPCVSEELVRFSRLPDELGVHWYATAKGRTVGNELYAKTARALPEPAVEGEVLSEALSAVEPPDLPSLDAAPRPGRRRRVIIGSEREQPSERAYSFE
jgi:hypothetical protein